MTVSSLTTSCRSLHGRDDGEPSQRRFAVCRNNDVVFGANPVDGANEIFGFLTTEANAIVAPISG